MKAYEVITVYSIGKKMHMGKYLVITDGTTPWATTLVPLRPGEEILQAKELHYRIIMEDK